MTKNNGTVKPSKIDLENLFQEFPKRNRKQDPIGDLVETGQPCRIRCSAKNIPGCPIMAKVFIEKFSNRNITIKPDDNKDGYKNCIIWRRVKP